jgi:hypothetical protein
MCKHSYFKHKNEMQSNKLNIRNYVRGRAKILISEISPPYKTEMQLRAFKG